MKTIRNFENKPGAADEAPPTIRFNQHLQAAFQNALRSEVDAYFSTTGQHIKGNALIWLKAAIFFLMMVAGYALLLTRSATVVGLFANYLIYGFGSLFLVITVAHDASHGAFSNNKKTNRWLSYTWNLIGLSKYFWEAKHHDSHHSLTNVVAHDLDIEQTRLLRMSPAAPLAWFHRYQHLYVLLLYALFGLFAVTFREFKLFQIKRFGNKTFQHSTRMLFRIIGLKVWYLLIALVLPVQLINLPVFWILAAFVFMLMATGTYIIFILAIPHINMRAIYKQADENGIVQANWFTHQLESTVDYSTSSSLLNWFSGGLNTHVAHHLFPRICHIHYQKITPIIEKNAREYGITYQNISLWAALRCHFSLLKTLGQNTQHVNFQTSPL